MVTKEFEIGDTVKVNNEFIKESFNEFTFRRGKSYLYNDNLYLYLKVFIKGRGYIGIANNNTFVDIVVKTTFKKFVFPITIQERHLKLSRIVLLEKKN
jgi:hypothetical protein